MGASVSGQRGLAPGRPSGAYASRRALSKRATREAIVIAANELFDEVGYSDARTSEIAKRAQVAQATLFRYFPTKADLALCHIEAALARLVDSMGEQPPSDPVHRALMAAVASSGGPADLNGPQASVEGRRLVVHEQLAAHLCWFANGLTGRLAADFEVRLDTGRGAALPRALAAAVLDTALCALHRRYEAPSESEADWLERALGELRPLFATVRPLT